MIDLDETDYIEEFVFSDGDCIAPGEDEYLYLNSIGWIELRRKSDSLEIRRWNSAFVAEISWKMGSEVTSDTSLKTEEIFAHNQNLSDTEDPDCN